MVDENDEEGSLKVRARSLRPTLIDVSAANIDRTGFFCLMSRRKSEGYARKLAWVKARLAEGMRLKLCELPDRGFVEYIPGEYAWRAVRADGYMVIHCLWVVGRSKGRGLGTALLEACLADAKRAGMRGVAILTSEGTWLAGRRFFERRGFEAVDAAPSSFSLMVRKFGRHPSPSIVGGFEGKARALGPGLTIVRTDQCPYNVGAIAAARAAAASAGIESRLLELTSREDVLRLSPSPYGTFGLVLDGRLLSFHYETGNDLAALFAR